MKEFLRRIVGATRRPSGPTGQALATPLMACVDVAQLAPPEALLRLGTAYGGWIIPADPGLDGNSMCYLAGAGEDISFDCALVQRFHCHVRIIDPTPRAVEHFRQLGQAIQEGRRLPVNNSTTEHYDITLADFARLTFVPVGLADRDVELKFFLPKNPAHVSCSTVNLQNTEDFFTAQCHRLGTVMAQQGDTRVDLLKIDIEGAEYSVIHDLVASRLLPRILLIEFDEAHSPQDDGAAERIRAHVRLLVDAGMRCIAVDGNNMTLVRGMRT